MARKTSFHNLEIEMARARKTQSELAEILGITETTLSMKLNGKSNLSLNECIAIKQVLCPEETVDYLFAEDTEKQTVREEVG